MLQYNITFNQHGRPQGIAHASGWSLGVAIGLSLGLHGLAVAMALTAFGPQPLALDDSAIAIYVESETAPVATASEAPAAAVPATEPETPLERMPEPEPEATAVADLPKELQMPDVVPPPPEALAAPDFSQPPPPRPKPAQPAERPAAPKAEPRRTAPSVQPARPAAAAPAESASAAPAAAATTNTLATVAPGWNALLAAWLAANRRYPDEARRRSEEGEVTVRFTVVSDGRVSEAAVVKGSGFAALDAAALRLLQGATLPAPGIEATRTVRIRFRLGD